MCSRAAEPVKPALKECRYYWLRDSIKCFHIDEYFNVLPGDECKKCFDPPLFYETLDAIDKCSGQKIVLKIFLKNQKAVCKSKVKHKIGNWLIMRDKNISCLYNVYESVKAIYYVCEAHHGCLLDLIADESLTLQKSENEIKDFIRQILLGVKFLHDRRCVHRNITTETIMYEFNLLEKKIDLKIDDYFFEPTLTDQVMAKVSSEDLEFSAPEALSNSNCDPAADIWSVGVLTFLLLSGISPFRSTNTEITAKKILKADYNLNIPELEPTSLLAKDFIWRLIKEDPSKRLTANQALEHKWLAVQDPLADIVMPRSASTIYMASKPFSSTKMSDAQEKEKELKLKPVAIEGYANFTKAFRPTFSMEDLKKKPSESVIDDLLVPTNVLLAQNKISGKTQKTVLSKDNEKISFSKQPANQKASASGDSYKKVGQANGSNQTEEMAKFEVLTESDSSEIGEPKKPLILPEPKTKIIVPSKRADDLAQIFEPPARKENDYLPLPTDPLTDAFLRLQKFYVLRKIQVREEVATADNVEHIMRKRKSESYLVDADFQLASQFKTKEDKFPIVAMQGADPEAIKIDLPLEKSVYHETLGYEDFSRKFTCCNHQIQLDVEFSPRNLDDLEEIQPFDDMTLKKTTSDFEPKFGHLTEVHNPCLPSAPQIFKADFARKTTKFVKPSSDDNLKRLGLVLESFKDIDLMGRSFHPRDLGVDQFTVNQPEDYVRDVEVMERTFYLMKYCTNLKLQVTTSQLLMNLNKKWEPDNSPSVTDVVIQYRTDHCAKNNFRFDHCGVILFQTPAKGAPRKVASNQHLFDHCGRSPYKLDHCGVGYKFPIVLDKNSMDDFDYQMAARHLYDHCGKLPYKIDNCGLNPNYVYKNLQMKFDMGGTHTYRFDHCAMGMADFDRVDATLRDTEMRKLDAKEIPSFFALLNLSRVEYRYDLLARFPYRRDLGARWLNDFAT